MYDTGLPARLDHIYNPRLCVRTCAGLCIDKMLGSARVCARTRHVCMCGGLPAYFVILIARGRPPPLLQPRSAPSPPTPQYTAPLHPMLTPPFPPRLVLVFHSTSPIRKPSTLRQPPVTRSFVCWCGYDDIRAVTNMYRSYIASMCAWTTWAPYVQGPGCFFLIAAIEFRVSSGERGLKRIMHFARHFQSASLFTKQIRIIRVICKFSTSGGESAIFRNIYPKNSADGHVEYSVVQSKRYFNDVSRLWNEANYITRIPWTNTRMQRAFCF